MRKRSFAFFFFERSTPLFRIFLFLLFSSRRTLRDRKRESEREAKQRAKRRGPERERNQRRGTSRGEEEVEDLFTAASSPFSPPFPLRISLSLSLSLPSPFSPPSHGVSSGPKITAFQRRMLSAVGEPLTPCGGSCCRRRKSRIRRCGVFFWLLFCEPK